MFEKGAETHDCTAKLLPYDLHLNVYSSPPGDQGTFFLLILCTYIFRNPEECLNDF